nr:uroporphyrinogen-III synthase [Mesobacillus campisalis]
MLERLAGKRIALAGSRKTEEISKIIANLGGIPVLRPAQGTVFLDDSSLEEDIRELVEGKYDWFIFTTGIGTETLHKHAGNLGLQEGFAAALRQAKVAARGYKTVQALKNLGLVPVVRDDDGSMAGLLRSMKAHSFRDAKVALQLHGDPAPQLIQFLEGEGAESKEILPYHHIPPETEVLEQLLQDIINGDVDAVNFTSTPQVRFLFAHGKEKGLLDKLIEAFAGKVVAVAVGKVTAAALRDAGVERVVVPGQERMGSAIVALEQFYKENQ